MNIKIHAALIALAIKLISMIFPGIGELPATNIYRIRYEKAADSLSREVAFVYYDLSYEEQEKRAKIAFDWAYHESGWQSNPKGDNDNGMAAGVMQVHVEEFSFFGSGITKDKVRANLDLGFYAGLTVMRYYEDKCGDLRSAMTAFSTYGNCPKPGYSIKVVLDRCKEAGVPNCL